MIGQALGNDGIIERLAEIFQRRGAEAYLGEDVTMADHMLQCAALAQAEGAPDGLVVAALLHDIGYFTDEFEISSEDSADSHHDAAGAAFLRACFPASISETVGLHVAAKRYLCAVEKDYHAKLSSASKHSLSLQGGPMSAAEIQDFRNLPYYREAVRLRLWDDAGKTIGLGTQSFDAYRILLRAALS